MSNRRKRHHPESADSAPLHPIRRELPRYRIILHADAAKALMFVVHTVMELMRFCREEATHKMWEWHHTGQSRLLVTHLERAELYLEQFSERGLNVRLEPAD